MTEQRPSTMSLRPARRKGRRRPHWRAAGAALSFALLSLVIVAGLAVYTFAGGRVDLEPLRPLAVSSLQERVGAGHRLAIDGLALERDGRGLALALSGLAIFDGDGRRILSAPKAQVHFSAMALFSGAFEPNRVDVEDLQVLLRILPDGGVDLSFGADEAPIAVASPPQPGAAAPAPREKILAQIGRAINSVFDVAAGRDSPIAQLDHFGVRRGRLALVDLAAGQTRGFENFAFALDRKHEGGQSVAEVNVAADGPNGRWRLRGDVRGARDEPRSLTLEASGFTIDELTLALGRNLPIDSDISLDVKAEASFQADGHVLDAHARLGLSSGFWRYDDPDFAPTFIDEAFAALRWETGVHRLVIDQAQVFSGPTRLFMRGAVSAPAQPGGPWAIQFEQTEPGTIGPDRIGEKAITLAGFQGDLSLDPEAKRLEVKRVEMRGPEVAAAMQGAINWVDGPHVQLGISMAKTPAAGVLALWPNAFGAAARGWLGDHLQGGVMENMRLAVDLDDVDLRMMRAQIPPMDDRILIDYTIKDAAFTFLEGAPAATGVSGHGRTTGRSTLFKAAGGVMESAPGHRIDLSDGEFSMPNIALKPMPMRVSTRVRGPVDVLSEILARPALEKIASPPLDPKTVKGQFDGIFAYSTKLGPGADPAAGALEVNCKIENFSAERLVGREKLDQGSLTVTVADGVAKITGTGKLFGANAAIDLTRRGDEPAQGSISFVMDDAARAKAGFNFGNSISGPMAVRLSGSVGAARPQAQVEIDLAKTSLNYPMPGLYKPAGRPAKASFSYREEERGGATFDQIAFDGGGASARGAVQLGENGLVSARFSQLKFSPGDSLQLDVSKNGETLKIVAKGESLDARPFLKSFTRGMDRSDATDIDLDLQATVMSGANRQILSNAVLRLSKKGTNYRGLTFSGKIGGDLVEVSLSRPDNGPPLLKATATDAGGLLAFLDLYEHMEGGRLRAAFRMANGGLAGPVDIDKFVLRGEPAIRSFASAPANEQFAARAQLNAEAVPFSRLHAVIDNRDGVLRVRDGAIASTNIGSTLDGVVDFNHDALDFSGTFVPAYGVNNLFGQLPVVGLILGGGDKEGLIGVNFRVTGRPGAPVLSVNPLSAITPGILRKVFGAFPTDVGN